MALVVVVVMFEPAVIAGPALMPLVVVVIAGPVEMADLVEYALVVVPTALALLLWCWRDMVWICQMYWTDQFSVHIGKIRFPLVNP